MENEVNNKIDDIQEESSKPEPEIKKSNNWLWIAIGIVILLIIGALGYWMGSNKSEELAPVVPVAESAVIEESPVVSTSPATSSTADVTSSWKTYSNDTYGFNFKYPSDWQYSENTLIPFTVKVANQKVLDGIGMEAPDGYYELAVNSFPAGYNFTDLSGSQTLSGSTDLVNFVRSMEGLLPNENWTKVTQESKTIGGQNAIRFTGNGYETGWYLKLNSNIYSVKAVKSNSTIDQILSTFQFTK